MDRNRFIGILITVFAASVTVNCASAQQPGEQTKPTKVWTPRIIALAPPNPGAPKMTVSSSDFAGQNYKDVRFFNPHVPGAQNISPGVEWLAGPAGTRSYVVVMEGQGGAISGLRPHPTLHWIVYNIPANVTKLPREIPTDPYVKDPAGALQGLQNSATGSEDDMALNARGQLVVSNAPGWRGPNYTAEGGTPHPYHFEIFALDTILDVDPAKAKRSVMVEAMKGHVLASGEVIYTFGLSDFQPPK